MSNFRQHEKLKHFYNRIDGEKNCALLTMETMAKIDLNKTSIQDLMESNETPSHAGSRRIITITRAGEI